MVIELRVLNEDDWPIYRWAVMNRAARTLRLSVLPDNGRAIALYERHGFEDTGEPGDLLRDGVGRKQVLTKILRGGVGYRR